VKKEEREEKEEERKKEEREAEKKEEKEKRRRRRKRRREVEDLELVAEELVEVMGRRETRDTRPNHHHSYMTSTIL